MSEVLYRKQYEAGQRDCQHGIKPAEQSEIVRTKLEEVLTGHERLAFGGIHDSSFRRFSDNSGKPKVARVIRDGHFTMEEDIYSELLRSEGADIVQSFLDWKDMSF